MKLDIIHKSLTDILSQKFVFTPTLANKVDYRAAQTFKPTWTLPFAILQSLPISFLPNGSDFRTCLRAGPKAKVINIPLLSLVTDTWLIRETDNLESRKCTRRYASGLAQLMHQWWYIPFIVGLPFKSNLTSATILDQVIIRLKVLRFTGTPLGAKLGVVFRFIINTRSLHVEFQLFRPRRFNPSLGDGS